MDFFNSLRICFLFITLYISAIEGQDTCVKQGPCTCVFPNGTGIDLKPVSTSTFYSAQMYKIDEKQIELSTYYYHPCYDTILPVNSTSPGDSCNTNLTLCRHVFTLQQNDTSKTFKKDTGVYNFLGSTTNFSFSNGGDAIIYGNLPSKTTVNLVCAQTEDRFVVTSLAEPNNVLLTLYSRAACLTTLDIPSENGRSLGSTLLIIFFSLTIFYLVLGICTKKFLMGATGVEVIPNLGFWTDLPNLIKDGWAFAIAGFKLPVRGSGPALSPDPNSYDSI